MTGNIGEWRENIYKHDESVHSCEKIYRAYGA